MLNNVETYANVPKIILQGADWFRTIGTEGSPEQRHFLLQVLLKTQALLKFPWEQHFAILFMILAAD